MKVLTKEVLRINLSSIIGIKDLLREINQIENLNCGDSIDIEIDTNGRVDPAYLCILVAWIKKLEHDGIIINKEIRGINTYASRINFYRQINYDYTESFMRHNSNGRFVEITNTNSENTVEIVNEIMDVIENNMDVEESIFNCLSYCLMEVVDNINEHSESPIDGYVVVQNFSWENKLSIAIVDSGVGIHNSLKNSGKEEFKDIKEVDALEECLKEGVTRFEKRGYGLYHTSKFIRANKGKMQIFSGNSALSIIGKNTRKYQCDLWKGTIMYFEIKTNKPVNFIEVFDNEDMIPTTVSESRDVLNGYI